MIKVIFFDFDGVLTRNGHSCNETCKRLEPIVKIPATAIEPVFHNMAEKLLVSGKRYRDYIDDINEKLGTKLTTNDLLETIKNPEPNSEMIKILNELRRKQLRTGMITDNGVDRLEMIRQHPDFKHMSPIVGSSEVGYIKSVSEKIFTQALNRAQVTASESIFIDNSMRNLSLPKEMGFHTYFHNEYENNVGNFKKFLQSFNLL